MEELLAKARTLFFSYGLKSVSMDDLAREAGTSKKTIYQSVADKNELVEKVVADLIRIHSDAMCQCQVEAKDAVEEVFLKSRAPFVTLASVNRNFFYELEKFFPAAWQKLITHRQQVMLPAIVKNLQTGINEEHYRDDLNIRLIAHIRMQQIITALNPRDFDPQASDTQKIMMDLTEFYLHVIVTRKGKRLLNKYLNLNNENNTNG